MWRSGHRLKVSSTQSQPTFCTPASQQSNILAPLIHYLRATLHTSACAGDCDLVLHWLPATTLPSLLLDSFILLQTFHHRRQHRRHQFLITATRRSNNDQKPHHCFRLNLVNPVKPVHHGAPGTHFSTLLSQRSDPPS